MPIKISISIIVAVLAFFFLQKTKQGEGQRFMAGLTMVAPPEPFATNPLPPMVACNADWIAVVPYAITQSNHPSVLYNTHGHWWGETPEGILESIRLAKEAKVRVMMKPQVWVPDGWTGDLFFEDSAACRAWEKDYTAYMLEMAAIADSTGLEMMCIGTEFRKHISQRPSYWFDLIERIRAVYTGKLTYSANWDDYQDVPFWEKLDYVGISAYFPLLEDKTPTVAGLKTAWLPIVGDLENFSKKTKRPILFTEYGYLSTDFCAWQTWELEKKISTLDLNETAQANAIEALLAVFSAKKWWAGGFLWKWFPNQKGHEGYLEKDYSPQGKAAEKVLKRAYAQ